MISNVFSWTFKFYLVKDPLFISYIEDKLKLFLETNDSSGTDPSLLWETLKAYARGMNVNF